jgi:hypothetical protein
MPIPKKWIASSLCILLVVSLFGCFTIKVGGKAQLAPSDEEGTLVAEKRCWYALWGLVPLGDNSTDHIIPPQANKVRLETKYTVWDALMNMFTVLVTIESFSVKVYEVK